ncbi:MAG TPA: Mov34/MPN/PAD-1 family protein [Pyrinomonadaceae bacterium]|jgi:hypothetical protein
MSHPTFRSNLDSIWADTAKSNKENAGWVFYDVKRNTVEQWRANEGEAGFMPNEPKEYQALLDDFQRNGRNMILIVFAHTHPKGTPFPSGGITGQKSDVGNLARKRTGPHSRALGVVIHGPGAIFLL